MARKARIDAPGAVHHIIIRGIEHKKIFLNDEDRENFVGRLGKIIADTKTDCFAWVLMLNHAHLLLRTGVVPLSTLMRRLLTGYAVSFNRKYRRHGQLFQNRYKSILCQENIYLKELIRYIHLNPVRASIIADMKGLDKYAWSGHSVIMGKRKNNWQAVDYVLKIFDNYRAKARIGYRLFIKEGIDDGKIPDLTGGGLIRSTGGWEQVKLLRKSNIRLKGDERILGDSDFVLEVLKTSREQLQHKYELKACGYDFSFVIDRVAGQTRIKKQDILKAGKQPKIVEARSLVCYFAHQKLGITTVEIAQKLGICQSAVSRSSFRGEKLARKHKFKLINNKGSRKNNFTF